MSDWCIAMTRPNDEGFYFPDDLPELADSPEWTLLVGEDEGLTAVAWDLTVTQALARAMELGLSGSPVGG